VLLEVILGVSIKLGYISFAPNTLKGVYIYLIGSWGLFLDGISMMFLFLTGVLVILCILYAFNYNIVDLRILLAYLALLQLILFNVFTTSNYYCFIYFLKAF